MSSSRVRRTRRVSAQSSDRARCGAVVLPPSCAQSKRKPKGHSHDDFAHSAMSLTNKQVRCLPVVLAHEAGPCSAQDQS